MLSKKNLVLFAVALATIALVNLSPLRGMVKSRP